MNLTKIFECAKLLEVEETQPAAGGDAPTYGIGKQLEKPVVSGRAGPESC